MQPSAPKPAEAFYLLINDNGTAETAMLGEERCLCVFTDPAQIGPFYASRHGDFDTRDVATRWFDGPDALRGFLKGNEATLAGQGIRHLAMNPAPGRSVDRVPIRTFIEAATEK